MKIDRAIEIIDPNHRECYEDLEEVNEACRFGVYALQMLKASGISGQPEEGGDGNAAD